MKKEKIEIDLRSSHAAGDVTQHRPIITITLLWAKLSAFAGFAGFFIIALLLIPPAYLLYPLVTVGFIVIFVGLILRCLSEKARRTGKGNLKKKPKCDFPKCENKAYCEVYYHHKGGGWSYLCRKHFEQERKLNKRLDGYSIVGEDNKRGIAPIYPLSNHYANILKKGKFKSLEEWKKKVK